MLLSFGDLSSKNPKKVVNTKAILRLKYKRTHDTGSHTTLVFIDYAQEAQSLDILNAMRQCVFEKSSKKAKNVHR